MPSPAPLTKLAGLLPALESLHAAAAQSLHANQLLACRNARAAALQSAQSAMAEAKQVSQCACGQHAWPLMDFRLAFSNDASLASVPDRLYWYAALHRAMRVRGLLLHRQGHPVLVDRSQSVCSLSGSGGVSWPAT